VRSVAIAVAVLAVVGFGWIFSLPSKAECVASGRTVDPTERHCDSPGGGYQQLQEHALFHSREVILGVAVVLGVAYSVRRLRRRRLQARPPTA
jgi:hypothetical protein